MTSGETTTLLTLTDPLRPLLDNKAEIRLCGDMTTRFRVPSLVIDPEFMQMSPADQQATLAYVDPEFGKLSPADFSAKLTALQKRAIAVIGHSL
jgi:hypothetical protein